MPITRKIGWLVSALTLAFGCIVYNPEAGDKWLVLTVFLYGIPLASQLFQNVYVRTYGAWFGIFLLAQALYQPSLSKSDYKTLPPNMDKVVDARGLQGISGFQHVTTDEKGFRTTSPVDYEDDAPYRIFAVGGSTTKQENLDDRKTWTHLLQEKLAASTGRNFEVINTGLHGLRAKHHLATIQATTHLNPDMYVILIGANDWMWHQYSEFGLFSEKLHAYSLEKTRLGRSLHPAYMRAKSLIGRNPPPPEPARDSGAAVENMVRATFGDPATASNEAVDPYILKRGSLFRPKKRIFLPESVGPAYLASMREIAELCAREALNCVFVTQPTGYKENISTEYMQSFTMTGADRFKLSTLTLESLIHVASLYNRFLIDFAVERNLPLCDLDAVVEPSFESFYDDMHFNESGAQTVAEFLHECLSPIVSGS